MLVAALLLVAAGVCGIWAFGSAASAPQNHSVGSLPDDLVGKDVSFGAPESPVRGWLVPAEPAAAAVILMHGVRADRRVMLDRARFLHAAGYAVLLFDFQAHGESPGEAITFGYRESSNVGEAVALVRSALPGNKIGIIGVSLGGASAVLAGNAAHVDAMILEAVYPTIEDAIGDRIAIRLGAWSKMLTPLLTWQFKPRLGFGVSELRPIDRIGSIAAPKLLIAGTADQHTPIAESRALLAAAGPAAEFWAVEGAAHVDFYAFAGRTYEEKVLDFFGRTLR
jgi:fermentation-respiration switch protein FrsA (DUF1100 family)